LALFLLVYRQPKQLLRLPTKRRALHLLQVLMRRVLTMKTMMCPIRSGLQCISDVLANTQNKYLQRGITLIIHMPLGNLLDYEMRFTCDGKCWKFECQEELPPKMHKPKELLKEAFGEAHPAAVTSYEEELARLQSRSDEDIPTKFSIKLNFEVQEQINFSRMLKTKSHQRILIVQLLAPDTNYMAKPNSKKSAEVDH
jgi:hypothetical protein